MRRFRQSLVCRSQIALHTDWEPTTAVALHSSTRVEEVATGTFAKGEFRMSTSHPVPLRYLRRLIGLWPESEAVSTEDADVALALFRAGAIDLHGAPSLAVRFLPGMRPCADSLIRFQARRGEPRLTTLCHEAVAADGGMRRLLALLDGTRDCEALARETGSTIEVMAAELADLAGLGVLTTPSK